MKYSDNQTPQPLQCSSISNQKTLDISLFELICESAKIYVFRNPESSIWTGYGYLIFDSMQTPQQLRPLAMSSLKKHDMCWPLSGSLLLFIRLVLVFSCEPVNVETESRNFSALEAQRVYRSSLYISCLRL